MNKSLVLIGIGSNFNEPLKQIKKAIIKIINIPRCRKLSHSKIYLTKPLGIINQPLFYNITLLISTKLYPVQLLSYLKKIEKQQNRVRGMKKNIKRSIDLDIIDFDQLNINNFFIQIPHPRFFERDFILISILEIYPKIFFLWFKNINYKFKILKSLKNNKTIINSKFFYFK